MRYFRSGRCCRVKQPDTILVVEAGVVALQQAGIGVIQFNSIQCIVQGNIPRQVIMFRVEEIEPVHRVTVCRIIRQVCPWCIVEFVTVDLVLVRDVI